MPPTPCAKVTNPCVPPQHAKPSTDGSVVGVYLGCGCITMLAAMVLFFFVAVPDLAVQRSNTAIQAKISALTAKQQIESQQWDEARNTLEAVIATGNADKSTLAKAHELLAQVNDKIRQEEIRQGELEAKELQLKRERSAEQPLVDAKSRIDSWDLKEARTLLLQYLRQSNPSKKDEAQRLLTELLTVTSESVIREQIKSMNDAGLDQVRATGTINGCELTNPTLNAIYKQTIRQCLEEVVSNRDESKRARAEGEKARLEAEKMNAAAEAAKVAAEQEKDRHEAAKRERIARGITAKELEVYGRDMIFETKEMPCTFVKIYNSKLKSANLDQILVGFWVRDRNGDLFTECYANKSTHAEQLLSLKEGTPLFLKGDVIEILGNTSLAVTDISEQ